MHNGASSNLIIIFISLIKPYRCQGDGVPLYMIIQLFGRLWDKIKHIFKCYILYTDTVTVKIPFLHFLKVMKKFMENLVLKTIYLF